MKFCYVHVPKCGGNSVALAFINSVPVFRRYTWVPVPETRQAVSISETGVMNEALFHDDGPNREKVYAFRRNIATMAMQLEHDYIGGHFLFDPSAHQAHQSQYAWVTVLRDPVSRMISHYREEVRSGFVGLPFEEYLETPMARAHSTTITQFLAGWSTPCQSTAGERLSAALRNLEKFATIGFLNNLSHFEHNVTSIAGKHFCVGHSRKARGAQSIMSDRILDQVTEMCRDDIAVYEAAREKFGDQVV